MLPASFRHLADCVIAFRCSDCRRISFDIPAGETFVLLGESGCGKSMTALSLLRLLPDGVAHAGGNGAAG